MIRFTGHPVLDVGVATIVAFAGKEHPEELTQADLEAIADFMSQNYSRQPLRSFLTVAFPNADGFTQPAYFGNPEIQERYADLVLRAFRDDKPTRDEIDPLLGLPVVDLPLDVKGNLEPGRAFRQHIPLQTAVGIINFLPYGQAGLPVSGLALLAIQAFPLGSAKCAGRLLAVHSDNPDILLHFARHFLEENRRAITLAQQKNSSKMPEPHLKYRTLLIDTLLSARDMQRESQELERPFSITAYHLTNSGQRADLAIYHLPSQVILYLKKMLGADYVGAWRQIVRRGWERPKLKRGETEAPADFQPSRNWLYEDLFALAENIGQHAPRFIRIYFLRQALRYVQNDPTDPRGRYSLSQEADLVSWKLAEPFLRRMMGMEPTRIEQIRALGDALADYVKSQNDRAFFRNFYTEPRYGYLRNQLIKANTAHVRRGNPPFLTLDNYIAIFEEGEDLARTDWRLARDLVLIRLVEQLYANGWLGVNEDIVAESLAAAESAESSQV